MSRPAHGGAQVVERPEGAEVARAAGVAQQVCPVIQGSVVQRTADQAGDPGRRRVERAALFPVVGRVGLVQVRGRPVGGPGVMRTGLDGRVIHGRVIHGRLIDGHLVVCQCMCRAAEEEGRLGQPRVERGRAVGGPRFDTKPTEFHDLFGRQAESSCDLVGVAVELGSECRVDSEAGHGIAKGVVGHVLMSPSVCACRC